MSAGFETTDTMHYHSRAIREGLKASISRLAHAKAHIPAPEFAASNNHNNIQQDWAAPNSVDFDKACLLGRNSAQGAWGLHTHQGTERGPCLTLILIPMAPVPCGLPKL